MFFLDARVLDILADNERGMLEERAENGRDSAAQWMVERIEDALGPQSDAACNAIQRAALRIMADDDAADEARRV